MGGVDDLGGGFGYRETFCQQLTFHLIADEKRMQGSIRRDVNGNMGKIGNYYTAC